MEDAGLKRGIGLFSGTALVVANMVGTGVFTTSGFIIEEVGNPQAMLLCWFFGGVLALCGALCYGELGAMFPQSGGEYVFLRESFGKWMGFLSGWISLIVGFSAPIAAASVAFSSYFYRSCYSVPVDPYLSLSCLGVPVLTISPVTLLSIAVIIVFSMLHSHSLLLGSRVQNGLTTIKVGFILVFILTGLFLGNGTYANFSATMRLGEVFRNEFAISLIFVSFAYSGWNAAVYLAGEIKVPGRNIPLALGLGTCIVTCLYLSLNTLYIYALPVGNMAGVLEVGAKSASSLFGEPIGRYFGGAISFCLLSVLSAMIMAGPRVYYAMSKDGVFFEVFGRINPDRGTPMHSIVLQAVIAIMMVITAAFETLLIYIGFTLSLFATLTVIGMILLRTKKYTPALRYRTFGYPVTPLVFVTGNIWIIYFSIKGRPVASAFGLITIGVGVLIYTFFVLKKGRTARGFK